MKLNYSNKEITSAIKLILSGESLSVNESYAKNVQGTSRQCYMEVLNRITSKHGMRFNWPKKITAKSLEN
jgi:hypothetical protein